MKDPNKTNLYEWGKKILKDKKKVNKILKHMKPDKDIVEKIDKWSLEINSLPYKKSRATSRVIGYVQESSSAEHQLLLEALDVLEYYALPETYFAIGFLPDRPCGAFINDFSKTKLGMKPGKKAREFFIKANKLK